MCAYVCGCGHVYMHVHVEGCICVSKCDSCICVRKHVVFICEHVCGYEHVCVGGCGHVHLTV